MCEGEQLHELARTPGRPSIGPNGLAVDAELERSEHPKL
jgi:hypothetical protein